MLTILGSPDVWRVVSAAATVSWLSGGLFASYQRSYAWVCTRKCNAENQWIVYTQCNWQCSRQNPGIVLEWGHECESLWYGHVHWSSKGWMCRYPKNQYIAFGSCSNDGNQVTCKVKKAEQLLVNEKLKSILFVTFNKIIHGKHQSTNSRTRTEATNIAEQTILWVLLKKILLMGLKHMSWRSSIRK